LKRGVPPEVYQAVLDRDRWCVAHRMGYAWGVRCGGAPHVHHQVLRSHGGPHTLDNLILLCEAHHHMAHNIDRAGAEACGIIRRGAALRS